MKKDLCWLFFLGVERQRVMAQTETEEDTTEQRIAELELIVSHRSPDTQRVISTSAAGSGAADTWWTVESEGEACKLGKLLFVTPFDRFPCTELAGWTAMGSSGQSLGALDRADVAHGLVHRAKFSAAVSQH